MSNTQQNAQSSNPLGDGKKTAASRDNRILYGLLAILIAAFIWKMSDEDSQTMTISGDQSSSDRLRYNEDAANPSVDVEIAEAEIGPTKNAFSKKNKATKKSKEHQNQSIPKESASSRQYSIADVDDFIKNLKDDFMYIYASEISVPEGSTFDTGADGFLRLRKQLSINVSFSEFDDRGNLIPISDEQLNYQTPLAENAPVFNPMVSKGIVYHRSRTASKGERYPSTGIPYGTLEYPLKDTLPWHPYQSLAYIKEEREIFVAEKVRAMPTARDLVPYIPPSTLGDADTRMGYGVVIRPSKK